MRIARQHLYCLNLVTADFVFTDFVRTDAAFLNQAMACDNDEEFPLGVMPVLALGNPRFGDVDGKLAAAHTKNHQHNSV